MLVEGGQWEEGWGRGRERNRDSKAGSKLKSRAPLSCDLNSN